MSLIVALKFGEAKFDYLEKQEGTPTEFEYPKDLPNTIFNPPNILQDTRQSNCFGYFQPMIVLPDTFQKFTGTMLKLPK